MREVLIERLTQDLVGPYSQCEILDSRPTDVYLTGILWPKESKLSSEEDQRLGFSGGVDIETRGAGEEEEAPLTRANRPCSAGFSFATKAERAVSRVNVQIEFATYEPCERTKSNNVETRSNEGKIGQLYWKRHEHQYCLPVELDGSSGTVAIPGLSSTDDICPSLYVRSIVTDVGVLATITLINESELKESSRNENERLTMFQVRLEVKPDTGSMFIARPSRRVVLDSDDEIANLLYRNAHEFATGHVCSVEWDVGKENSTATKIYTNWLPKANVAAINPMGHEVFDALVNKGHETVDSPLTARRLAFSSNSEVESLLGEIPEGYGQWIELQELSIESLPRQLQHQATKNIETCRCFQDRMARGLTKIVNNPAMSKAFQLANLAMHVQYDWDVTKGQKEALTWRPFQIGFILLSAPSIASGEDTDRDVMDLLWFPTGGGKTEAYLALIAFLAFYRRLKQPENPDLGGGVAAIMRYTLRLLTTQQFSRAAAMVLACEAIRRGRYGADLLSPGELGTTPFSIGLWVGGDATPNTVDAAKAALREGSDFSSPKQILECPACQNSLHWGVDETSEAICTWCRTESCTLFADRLPLPIWTVDQDVYRQKPTLLIGTIDKFAQIVRRSEVSGLFGLNTCTTPDLIIQDELHLISGPLGTIAGLYEVAFDRMLSKGGTKPKIIGSTATIRRASEQASALFNRVTAQFPPPCIDAGDSCFAVVDDSRPGREYIGVSTVGRSAKFTLQAVTASLLQSVSASDEKDTVRDAYWTLVSYFNSLRELGGAVVLMQDDVASSLSVLAKRRQEAIRPLESIEELTSRCSQVQIRGMLDRLSNVELESAVDVLLATNMLSVGVDISRLALMLVNGQPKGVSEYIQATSRVGRGPNPGLVISILNNAKVRDRSHYESFVTWHETLYRDVEPTSVTPFASRARDKALHAVLVALIRHLVPGMLENPTFNEEKKSLAGEFVEEIVKRAKEIDPEETDVRDELVRCLDDWNMRQPQSYWVRNVRRSLLQDAERVARKRAARRSVGAAWPTLNNMRSVEPTTPFRLVERLSKESD